MFGLPRPTADGAYNEGYFNNTCIVLGERDAESKLLAHDVLCCHLSVCGGLAVVASGLSGGAPPSSGGAGVYFKVWEPLRTLLPNATGGLRFPVTVHSNRLYGNLSVCAGPQRVQGQGGWCHTMEEWLALGLDPGTAVVSTRAPPPAQIVELARRMLGV
jgi:hypothetical protein